MPSSCLWLEPEPPLRQSVLNALNILAAHLEASRGRTVDAAYVQALHHRVHQVDCLIFLSRRDWSDRKLYRYFCKRCKTFRLKCSQSRAADSGSSESRTPDSTLHALQAELNRYRDRFYFEIPRVGLAITPQPIPISEQIREDVHSIGRDIVLNLDRFEQSQSESLSHHLSSLAHRFA